MGSKFFPGVIGSVPSVTPWPPTLAKVKRSEASDSPRRVRVAWFLSSGSSRNVSRHGDVRRSGHAVCVFSHSTPSLNLSFRSQEEKANLRGNDVQRKRLQLNITKTDLHKFCTGIQSISVLHTRLWKFGSFFQKLSRESTPERQELPDN